MDGSKGWTMMDQQLIVFGMAVGLAYLYAFVGGFTDAANAIATSVGTRVLSPRAAVALAGVFNLLGGLTGTAVALTIGQGLVDPRALSLVTVVGGLAGAMTWSLFTYACGIPVSETHGLVGGLIGAAMATAGPGVVQWQGLTPVLAAIVASPTLGFLGGSAFLLLIYWSCRHRRPGKVNPWFKHLQRVSAAYMAFSHGRNDAQKPMGVLALALALYAGGHQVRVPLWVVVSCAVVAALGTAYGGWRIIQTLGQRIVALNPVQGFAAEAAGATVIQLASELGIPVSTTHAITAAILGAGSLRRPSAVRWALTADIFASWLLTLPVTMGLGALWVGLLGGVLAALQR
jgi:PiT family inorganic phosphate transporter